ncbi:MAG: hypothetical protein IT329_05995 [Caldilineaceae bacterium]|nr:hypothetical protein [Caldilineaceae bacterium]
MSLEQLFLEYNSDTLAEFIRLCAAVVPMGTRPTRKDQRAQSLAETLQNPAHLQRLYRAMDDLSRKAVASAYHNGGEFVADAFIAQYGSLPKRPEQSAWYFTYTPILPDLFIHQGQIPPELMERLTDLVPPPERFQVVGGEELEAFIAARGAQWGGLMVAETEKAGRHDLLLLLQLFDQRAVKLNSAGDRLTPTGLATLLQNLLDGDFYSPAYLASDRRRGATPGAEETIRAFGLTTFAIGAGLVSKYDGKLTELGRAFLTRQDPELLLDAFEIWTQASVFDELTRLDALKGLRAHGIRLTKPGLRRSRIVEALSWCPAGVWIEIAEFYRALKIWHFDFEVEEGGIHKLYMGYRYGRGGYYEPWADSRDMWLLVNGLYINAVLWEYLAVIGALDIAYLPPGEVELAVALYADFEEEYYSRYDGLLFFRINPLGAYLFGQAGDYPMAAPAAAPVLRVDADGLLQLLDPARLTPVDRAQLDQIATPAGEAAYRLDVQKVLLALEQGSDLEALRGFLARQNGQPLPSEVERRLDEMADAARAFSIEGPMLRIRAAHADLVSVVLADPELGKFCQALGSRDLVIPTSRETRFRNRLRALGYGLQG